MQQFKHLFRLYIREVATFLRSWEGIALLTATALYLLTRLYNLPGRIIFDWDQERDAYAIAALLNQFDITLIGPRVVGPEGFFLAPYYTYILAPFYAISQLAPEAVILFVVFYNILFISITYYVIRRLFSWIHGILFLVFWGGAYLLSRFDIIPWNALLVPVGITITWLILYRIYHNRTSMINWILLGIVSGLFINLHFQFIFILLFSMVVLLAGRIVTFSSTSWRYPALAVGVFGVMFAPLFLFDLRNNFLNTKLFVSFFLSGDPATPSEPLAWLPVLGNVFHSFYFVRSEYLAGAVLIVCIAATGYLYIKSEGFQKAFYAGSIAVLVATPLVFMAYGSRPSEYYFVYALPFIIVGGIDLILRNKKKYAYALALGVTGLFMAGNTPHLLALTKDAPFGLWAKSKTVQSIPKVTNDTEYYISISGDPGRDSGFKYILEYYGLRPLPPEITNAPLVQIRMPPRDEDITITDDIGLYVPDNLKRQ